RREDSITGESGRATPPPRLWPPFVLLGCFWAVYVVWRWTDLGITFGFLGFLVLMAIGALVTLLFVIWWLAASRVPWAERLLMLGTAVLAGLGAALLSDRSVGTVMVLPGLPLVLTAWAVVLLAARRQSSRARRLVLAAALCLTWGAFTLVRTEGSAGDGQPVVRWRWRPTAEEIYLAGLGRDGETAAALSLRPAMRLQPGDWPGFRGANRDGDLRGVRIATDWDAAPPRLVWRRRIGPAWSSVAVVGDRLFTQEQMGEFEAGGCLDAATRRTAGRHPDAARHPAGQGRGGPPATPPLAAGPGLAPG